MPAVIIPDLKEAVAHQNLVRDAAFILGRESVAGIAVRPLTVRHVAALQAVGNPFVACGVPEAADVAAFLWLVSPGYDPRARLRRWFFIRRLRRMPYLKLVEGIESWLAESFQDTQGGGKAGPTYFSFAAALVGLIASEYGWSESAILELPVKRALQYRNEIQRRNNPNAPMFQPADRVINRWLNRQTTTEAN